MVNFGRKKGKLFGKKGRQGGGSTDEASVVSTRSSLKFVGRASNKAASPSASPIPENVPAPPVHSPSPVAALSGDPEPTSSSADATPTPPPIAASRVTTPTESTPVTAAKCKPMKGIKSNKSKSPVLAANSPATVPEMMKNDDVEVRDAAPSSTPFPSDPVGDAAGSASVVEVSVSATSEEEQSYDESAGPSMEDPSQVYDENESATVETYEEDLSQGTSGDKSTFEEEYSAKEESSTAFSAKSAATAKGDDMTKKYFHKDVVLNSLEDGANSLVIRAMYFIPKPKMDDHIVVKIEASTISARDCMKCKGRGLTSSMLPFVPGFEVVGTVQAVGNLARNDGQFREGDRVAGVSTFGGGNSRFISIPAARLTKISNNVKSTQAVCMIHDYMAALKALRLAKKAGSPFTGMNILVTDGFSPVGQAVIALASMEGANIYCCADESKHSYLVSLGTKCFVKDPESWLPTATGTFDVVIDNSCIDSYSSSWFALNQKGTLVCLAPVFNMDGDDVPANTCGLNITELQQKWAGVKARYMMTQTSFLNTVTTYDDDVEQYKQDLRYLMFLLERGDIKPKVAERVSLDDVPDAQRLMQSGRANGTVVCVPWIEE